MRVSVVHDEHGFISALVASPPDAPVASLVPQAGERVTELDVPDIRADGDPQEVIGRLTDVVENYRVATDTRTLARRQP
ncbi:hypothetical protein [Streptomyces thermodiastaticus]|uniref:hypothetical protein n=1 Tax=Streptomyces thermodiastaticus TaxID=44061 RepID=UPI001676F257|nr:hypothetical protein [Streptomyces thermodiastaticus]MCE7552391.1 hypothetical protein [Streptomyces thermodiastaticus]GHF83586.1 hypothetical protein GCM10018787_35480 [Streptomyces thermodiastaticus]